MWIPALAWISAVLISGALTFVLPEMRAVLVFVWAGCTVGCMIFGAKAVRSARAVGFLSLAVAICQVLAFFIVPQLMTLKAIANKRAPGKGGIPSLLGVARGLHPVSGSPADISP
jgi:hypothetical protein